MRIMKYDTIFARYLVKRTRRRRNQGGGGIKEEELNISTQTIPKWMTPEGCLTS
jgi:hypothetical protein